MKFQVYQDLRYRIITHKLPPGQQLNEKELMAQYRIGRTPLREVLLELQRDGLIQRFPRTGTFVAPLDLHLFRQVVEIRIELEAFAARLAAERIDAPRIERLERILGRVAEQGQRSDADLELLTRCEFKFHDTLYEGAANPMLTRMLQELHGVSARFWHYLVFDRGELFEQFVELRRVFEALRDGDAEGAHAAVEAHIRNFVGKVRNTIL
jgi:DNA-binding GntR family transcriptional regulator